MSDSLNDGRGIGPHHLEARPAAQLGADLSRRRQEVAEGVNPDCGHPSVSEPVVEGLPAPQLELLGHPGLPAEPLVWGRNQGFEHRCELDDMQRIGGGVHDVVNTTTPRKRQVYYDKPRRYTERMSLRSDVSEQLRALRAGAGLSLGQVASKLGLSRSAMNDWERGKNGGTLDTIEEMAAACGGAIAIIIGAAADKPKVDAVRQIAMMSPAEVAPLLRFLAVWNDLPPFEREMVARMAEVRAEALSDGRPAGSLEQRR